jgi:predicted nucleic acid-binding protein
MMVFVDTGAWYARHVPSDPNHGRVKAWFDANEQRLLTTDYC